MAKKPLPMAITWRTSLSSNLDDIVASIERSDSQWKVVGADNFGGVTNEAGVYCFVLPLDKLPRIAMVVLHGRTSGKAGKKSQLQFRFQYQTRRFRQDAGAVIYVGKASNLNSRLRKHLSVNTKSTTNQVLRGLTGQSSHKIRRAELVKARERLQKDGAVFYYAHQHKDEDEPDHTGCDGIRNSYVADRDMLEIMLIAKFAPPFNIKAER